jgi:hypothetical protein
MADARRRWGQSLFASFCTGDTKASYRRRRNPARRAVGDVSGPMHLSPRQSVQGQTGTLQFTVNALRRDGWS